MHSLPVVNVGLPNVSFSFFFSFYSSKEYIAFAKSVETYKENSSETWGNWAFSVREFCRNLHLPPDQSWRMGNSIFPKKLKEMVVNYVGKRSFTGFC